MTASVQPASPAGSRGTRKPILASISLVLPVVVTASWMLVERHPHVGDGLQGYVGLILAVALYAGSTVFALAGIVLGIVSLVVERRRILGGLGIVVNGALALWLLGQVL